MNNEMQANKNCLKNQPNQMSSWYVWNVARFCCWAHWINRFMRKTFQRPYNSTQKVLSNGLSSKFKANRFGWQNKGSLMCKHNYALKNFFENLGIEKSLFIFSYFHNWILISKIMTFCDSNSAVESSSDWHMWPQIDNVWIE